MEIVENTIVLVRLQTFDREIIGSNPGKLLGIFDFGFLSLSVGVCACACVRLPTQITKYPLLSPTKSLPVQLYATVHPLT
jgi:hypothetical protein